MTRPSCSEDMLLADLSIAPCWHIDWSQSRSITAYAGHAEERGERHSQREAGGKAKDRRQPCAVHDHVRAFIDEVNDCIAFCVMTFVASLALRAWVLPRP